LGAGTAGELAKAGGLAGLGLDIGSRLVGHDISQGILPSLFAATQDVPGGAFLGPDGFRQLRGFPEIVKSSKVGDDADLAGRLWALSETLTGTTVGDGRLPAAKQ